MLFVVLTYRSIPAPLSKMNYPEGLGPDRKSTSATRGPTKIKFTLTNKLFWKPVSRRPNTNEAENQEPEGNK